MNYGKQWTIDGIGGKSGMQNSEKKYAIHNYWLQIHVSHHCLSYLFFDGIDSIEGEVVEAVVTTAQFPPMHPWLRVLQQPLGRMIIGEDAGEDEEGDVAEDADEVVVVEEVVEVTFEEEGEI